MTGESLSASRDEIMEKERRVREFLTTQKLDALVLTTQANFSWFTCGGYNFVATASDVGAASILITPGEKYILSDNIESPRLLEEEIGSQGFKFVTYKWWKSSLADEVARLAKGNIGADTPIQGTRLVAGDVAALRYSLTPQEVQRYRWLGQSTSQCMASSCQKVKPGMTEYQIAGLLSEELMARGIIPNLILVATDERAEKYRHPIPTDKQMRRYAMVVTCARKWGLIVSMTRIVHFGRISNELRRKHDAVIQVDAELISATRPGQTVGHIFRRCVDAYARLGFDGEWQFHHQGGATGYAGRDYRARPGDQTIVQPNQAFAWNPSIAGTKSEDTIIALRDHTEIISAPGDWPMIDVWVDGQKISRPDILTM